MTDGRTARDTDSEPASDPTASGYGNTRGALWVLFIVAVVVGLFYASHQRSSGEPAEHGAAAAPEHVARPG